jgi:CheY-like chemotaxis protein
MKFLIADHMKTFIELEKTFLRRADCQVITASSGPEALEVARNQRPDLIVLDVEMPGMDGLEVARTLAASKPPVQGIPVILLSERDLTKVARKAGAQEFIMKPVDEGVFLSAIRRHVPLKVRLDSRRPVDSPCRFRIGDREAMGTVANISTSGIFMHTYEQLRLGDRLDMRFGLPLPEGDRAVAAQSLVVRLAPPRGYGLGFSDISEDTLADVARFIEG